MTHTSFQIIWDSAKLHGKVGLDFSHIFAAETPHTRIKLMIPMVGDGVNSDENIGHYVNAKMAFAHATKISLSNASGHFDAKNTLQVTALEMTLEPSAVIKKLMMAGYINEAQGREGFALLAKAMDAALAQQLAMISTQAPSSHQSESWEEAMPANMASWAHSTHAQPVKHS